MHWAAAYFACPEPPVCDVDVSKHLLAYVNAMAVATAHGWRPQRPALADALASFISSMLEERVDRAVEAQERRLAALRLLTQPSSAPDVRRQLAEVAAAAAASAHPPAMALPSPDQLRFAFHYAVVKTGAVLLKSVAMLKAAAALVDVARVAANAGLPPLPHLAPQQAAALTADVVASGEALLRLQPNSPRVWLQAAMAADAQGRTALSVERLMRGAVLAKQQRADASFAICVSLAAAYALDADTSRRLPASLVARVAAAAAEVEPALKRTARLLPAPWVEPLQPGVKVLKLKLAALGGSRCPHTPAFMTRQKRQAYSMPR